MKVRGTATLQAPAERVWAALNDPAVLVQTIPGCEQLETVGPDKYRMTITAGVASIKGTYLGDVELADPQPPEAFTLKASGAGAPGTVSADVKVTLSDGGDGTTVLRYDADAVVGGTVGGVGQRVLVSVAKKTANEFFAAVNALLAEAVAAEAPPSEAAAAPTLAVTAPEPTRLPSPPRRAAARRSPRPRREQPARKPPRPRPRSTPAPGLRHPRSGSTCAPNCPASSSVPRSP